MKKYVDSDYNYYIMYVFTLNTAIFDILSKILKAFTARFYVRKKGIFRKRK